MKRLFVAALLTANLATACRIYDLYQDWSDDPDRWGWSLTGGYFEKGSAGILVLPDPWARVGWQYDGRSGGLVSISGSVEYAEGFQLASDDFELLLDGQLLTSGTVSYLNPGPIHFRFGIPYTHHANVEFFLHATGPICCAIANVSLVYETVPEPGTFGLMATAGLALLVAGYRHHHQT
ncbi:MAG: hypothetical protein NTV70_19740 [Acidobacteria bacterium]|nr:hypothetical protein [Acidobacteriota bacterium]